MAAKVTIADVVDAGFRAEQFGTPADWTVVTPEPGYLARLVLRAEVWARGQYGDGYAAVDVATPTGEALRAAELCFVSHHLWKRRAAFIDSNAVSSHDRQAYLDRREFEEQAARAWNCAVSNMALAVAGVTSDPGHAVVLAHAVSGPFRREGCAR